MIETTQEDEDGIFILNGVFAYSERYQQNTPIIWKNMRCMRCRRPLIVCLSL